MMKAGVFSEVLLLFSIIIVICGGLYTLIFDIDMQKCEMTYMFDYPHYHIIYNGSEKTEFKHYRLYHYVEQYDSTKLRGVPVLFIPGNSGSFKQVRSLASVSKQRSRQEESPEMLFNYFSIDFNEELSALSGEVLIRQSTFVTEVIEFLEHIYRDSPYSLVIVGHSMGGFIARLQPQKPFVRLIIALASPLETPILGADSELVTLYRSANKSATPTISVTGGNRDYLVPDVYGHISSPGSLWLPVWSVVRVGVSTDHRCIVWCRQLVLALTRLLHNARQQHLLARTSDLPPDPAALLRLASFLLAPQELQLATTRAIPGPRSWLLLLLLGPSTIEVHATHTAVLLPALSLTRPLRAQVHLENCEASPEDKLIIETPNNHQQHNYSLPVTDPAVLQITQSVPSVLHILLYGSPCRRATVTISAHPLDWLARLLHIHDGRLPAFVSIWVVLMASPRPHTSAALFMVLAALAWSWVPIGEASRYRESGLLDLADCALLLVVALPISRLLALLSNILLRIGLLLAWPLPIISAKIAVTWYIVSMTTVVVVIQPPGVIFAAQLLLLLLLASLSGVSGVRTTAILQHTVLAGLCTVLLHSISIVAQLHSTLQHDTLQTALSQWLALPAVHWSTWNSPLLATVAGLAIVHISGLNLAASASKVVDAPHTVLSWLLAAAEVLVALVCGSQSLTEVTRSGPLLAASAGLGLLVQLDAALPPPTPTSDRAKRKVQPMSRRNNETR